jgi:hypothetical protein
MFNNSVITRILNINREFLKTKIVYICRICKKRIPTTWTKNFELDGEFVANDLM